MAQLASASALGAEGPPFESEYPDKVNNKAFRIISESLVVFIKSGKIKYFETPHIKYFGATLLSYCCAVAISL